MNPKLMTIIDRQANRRDYKQTAKKTYSQP